MTDLECLKQMLTRAGVVFSEAADVTGASITIAEGGGPKNLGYIGFETVMQFNPDESLRDVGVWE